MSMRWIVSAENTPYMSWQCRLLRHSALSRCGVEPGFVVHKVKGADSTNHFHQNGAWIGLFAPPYRGPLHGCDYPPRNFPGSLLEASKAFGEDWFVLVDPDMIFTRKPKVAPGWSADRIQYGPADMQVGVPYVVEASRAEELAMVWLEELDHWPRYEWEAVMWAYVAAMKRLKIPFRVTEHVDSNYWPQARASRSMIHFCYGDARWDKRSFMADPYAVFRDIPQGVEGTVEEEIWRQLREVRRTL